MLKKSFTLALAVMLIMILSCRKEQQVNTLNKKGGNTAALRLAPEELEAITNDFITQSLSQQWNLGTYEYEDVVLMLEGALNYRTCTPQEYYDEIAIDSAAFQLDIFKQADDHWYVESERVIEFWNTLMQHAASAPERLQLTNGFNIVADLEVAGVDYETEKINVSVVIWAGNGSEETICDFTSNDYWLACAPVGGCYTNSNNLTSDSRIEIQKRLNNRTCNQFLLTGCDYYMYISLQGFSALNFPSISCQNYCFAILNYGGTMFIGYGMNDCISPQELECSVTETAKMASCNAPNVPGSFSNKDVISHNIQYAQDNNQPPYLWYHFVTVSNGKCNTYTPD
ncbi:MAG: hypothetical protein JNL47_08215 [Bacteroidia bacterium]|nr:hypothetical protein [Bacteroidia bacterium]